MCTSSDREVQKLGRVQTLGRLQTLERVQTVQRVQTLGRVQERERVQGPRGATDTVVYLYFGDIHFPLLCPRCQLLPPSSSTFLHPLQSTQSKVTEVRSRRVENPTDTANMFLQCNTIH